MTDAPLLSILDLSPVTAGKTVAQALRNSTELAVRAEDWGYHRFWVAEHHNLPGVATAATAVVIGHIAEKTSTIRVGAGGIMLPNHAPLVVAEQFGTLESLYPGRIDLGLGRAPGTDPRTARALRRHLGGSGDTFAEDVRELMSYFEPAKPGQAIRAVPGEGLDVPLYLLGSSDFSARLAARLGRPFAFASHFAPGYLLPALELYRSQYRPSSACPLPHVMVGVNVIAADTDEEARVLFTSLQQAFLNMVRGTPGHLPPPVESMAGKWSSQEQQFVEQMLRYSVFGSPATVRAGLEQIAAGTGADELIATAMIYDHQARLRSFELAARAWG